jgi:hypothetical protein
MTFITQKIMDNEIWEGARIYADSYEQANIEAIQIGVDVIGILDSEYSQVPV